MSDVTELLDAVTQMRTGSGLTRARGSLQAMQTIMRMSPDDKRAVALLVAERVAPQLVERIEAGTGQDLTKAQVETVVQLLQKLDAEDLDELRGTVTDAERRGVALRQVSQAAAVGAAAATGLDELVVEDDETDPHLPAPSSAADPLPPPADDPPSADEPAVVPASGEHDDPGAEDEPVAAAGPGADDVDDVEAVAAARAAADAELEQLEREAAAMKAEARRAQLDAEAEIARLTDEHAVPSAAATDEDPEPADTSASRSPDDNLFDELPEFDHEARTVARVPHDGARTAAASRATRRRAAPAHAELIRSAPTAATALAALRTALDDTGQDVDGLLGLVRLVPDGWARRRAVDELLRRDLLHGADAVAGVRCLAGSGDRRFLVGTILAARLATVDQLRGTVEDRTLDRIARRGQPG